MMKFINLGMTFALLFFVALLQAQPPAAAELGAHGLRCEYLVNPVGIDVRKPRLSWVLNPAANVRGQSAYRVLVASNPALLQKDTGDLWDSGRVTSGQNTWIEYAGKPLASGQQAFWKVRIWSDAGKASPWSAPANWSMGLLQDSDWAAAKWIGQARPAGTEENTPLPFPWLRKTIDLATKPQRAVAYVNPLGYYELYINGKKVDDHVLSPVVSDYSKRTIYVTHEIADYLVPGKNVIALWLGRGWYVRGHPGVIHDGPLVRARFDLGGSNQVVTDETWKLHGSPLTPLGRATAFGDYGGERYDPSLDIPDWNVVAFDDSAWQAAAVFQPPQVLTAAQMVEPNRITETLPAVSVSSYPQGGYVIDLGKNITGWLEVKLPAIPKGTVVKLEYSDQMEPDKPAPPSPFGPGGERRGGQNPQGAVTGGPPRAGQPGTAAPPGTAAAGGPPRAGAGGPRRGGNPTVFPNTFNQRDEIIGEGRPVTFRSRFNYHGFRYVRVVGLETPPAVADAKGYLIRTAYDRAGEFTSSNELLNRIYRMVTYTYEALTLGGYVVDCPTRERLGYGGDAGTSFETALFNFAAGGLYNSWLANWRDSQDPSGSLPHTAPNYQNQGGGGPMWGGMVVTLPWHMYLQYGDRRVLETNYPMMAKWLGYLASETQGDLLLDHKSHAMTMQTWNFLGDWLTPKGSFRNTSPDPSPAQMINSVHYLYQLQLASKIAEVLGKKNDAAIYNTRAAAVSKAVHARFFNPAENMYSNGDSVLQAFPLMTGVVPAELRKAVMAKLENTIRVRNQGHLDSGMHGTYFLMKYLWENGRSDLVYEMTSKESYPGWGYMLANGATTAWEGWTGQSHIHDTLISIGAWFTEGLAGIRSDGKTPGFKHFLIEPAVVGDLTFARAKYRSIHGEIISDWRIDNGAFKLSVTVPPGATATVSIPGDGPVQTKLRPPRGRARSFIAPPGTHTFETPLRPKG